MTDIDHIAIADAVFGGPGPTADAVRAYLAQQGITLPRRIVAVQGHWAKPPRSVALLHLHAGLTYAFVGTGQTARPPMIHGRAVPCPNAERWISAMQQAITSLRERELAGPKPRLTPEMLGQTRAVALARARRGLDWDAPMRVWVRALLRRHQEHLNSVRRKLVELLADLTSPIDESRHLGHPFKAAVMAIYQTHAFGAFEEVAVEAVRGLVPFVLEPRGFGQDRSRLVVSALTLLRERFTEPISLCDVAEALDTAPAHLARRFKAETGQTVVGMLHALRVGHARRLLIETQDTVLAVALDCGFGSAERLHRVFKAQTGQTPGAFRRALIA